MALPASEAYDYEGVRARLADPDLADAGVVVALLALVGRRAAGSPRQRTPQPGPVADQRAQPINSHPLKGA
ncbi:hypothetical protein HEP86_04865 [Streptomyces sp. RPA4-5]|uniref:hypothetical protein n=1 Tax=unclassified Streptomyces TaxID=2593676 RepID=UPI00143E7432|nr:MULTISPECIES: hypothetical protein [unclassified Streptomyces]MCX4637330.1 hypothetical protein [Streptomyces platensis]QIY53948.1 hypothetical protein HEP86_04865 [Streptomyces sp. RPA4-5]WJY36514.1 hypothetical protein QT196_04055 [Streptomyces sp. P9-2B-2]